jgi:hypothetical protein
MLLDDCSIPYPMGGDKNVVEALNSTHPFDVDGTKSRDGGPSILPGFWLHDRLGIGKSGKR